MEHKEVVILAALEAGEILQKYYQKSVGFSNLKFSAKDQAGYDYVTEADFASEKTILTTIKNHYPNHNFILEESSTINNCSEYTWLIDPLDGTTNFLRGIPFFSISIALVKTGEIILGCVYNPASKELFFAEKRKGASLNNIKISVSSKNTLSKAIVSQSFDYSNEKRKDNLMNINSLFFNVESLRLFHSTALELCNVACGRVDAHLVSNANSWDVAAGAFIVEEAGGKVTKFDNSSWDFKIPRIVATNKNIHTELTRKLKINFL